MKDFEVRFEGELPATPQEVWNAITVHTTGWYWKISYEPRVGGAERGLTSAGGTVTASEPPRHFATRAERPDGWWNDLDYVLEPRGGGTFLDYTHTSVLAEDDYDLELDACRRHTASTTTRSASTCAASRGATLHASRRTAPRPPRTGARSRRCAAASGSPAARRRATVCG